MPSRIRASTRVIDVMRRGTQLVTFTEPQPLIDAVADSEQTGLTPSQWSTAATRNVCWVS